MKSILIISLLFSIALSKNIIQKPIDKFIASGSVIDLVINGNKLYCATNIGVVDIFNIKNKTIIQKIKLSKIKDFMGDTIDSKVYSVDVINKKILILSQALNGTRRVHIFKNNKLNLIIPHEQKLFIAKAKFLDSNTIILGLLSNEIISFDIKNKKINYRIQISQSKFSNFTLSDDKSTIVVADESGDLQVLQSRTGKIVKTLTGQNLDNVFQVSYKNNVIATAGQDRRVVIYSKNEAPYYKTSKFLIYSVGLSANGEMVAYSSDEDNNINLFNTKTKKNIGTYGDNKTTITNILFINENRFISSSDNRIINIYNIKKR